MAKLAFLGLGLMGTPMATRLLGAGHDLTVWNRTPAKVDPLVELGARAAASPAEAVAGVEAVITMVATPQALERVLFGDDGAHDALEAGQRLIDMSTVGPQAIRSVARRLPDEVVLVDAPVRGSVQEATTGKLVIYVGATPEAFEEVQPLLAPLGIPHHVGGPGAGAATKLVVNLTLGVAITALGEALALGEELELDEPTLLDVLTESPIGSTVRTKRANVQYGAYPPSFKLSLALKDLRLVAETAARSGGNFTLAAAARDWLEQAALAGSGDLDYSAVVATIAAATPTHIGEEGQDMPKPKADHIRPLPLAERGPEVQRFGETKVHPIALGDDVSARSCLLVNRILADTVVLHSLYKKHHWHMHGPTFDQWHLLLDRHADEQLALIDLLAERVRVLGGVAVADPRHVAEMTTVPRPPNGVEEVPAMLSRLLEAHEIVIRKVRDAVAETAANRDDGTNDLLVSDVLRTGELQVWLIADHLVDPLAARIRPIARNG
jgi:3-hydroxyisobutyrate dehydrogenase-like beta-hydroxyacid dehydrogenase/DNA-binding ferritin-like protein